MITLKCCQWCFIVFSQSVATITMKTVLGFFIVLSLAWGALLDGFRPDVGDYVGAAVALVGVLIMMIWRRPA